MRQFTSYGPVVPRSDYYAPREELIKQAMTHLLGKKGTNKLEDGHYITVWGARQTGKTWIMAQVLHRLKAQPYRDQVEVLYISLEYLKMNPDPTYVIKSMAEQIITELGLDAISVETGDDLYKIFSRSVLKKSLILIVDEFDAINQEAIAKIVSVFRHIYIRRHLQVDGSAAENDFLLHGVALVGVRAVLGVENVTGSPFNVQRSLNIPNLTLEEVQGMFADYEQEHGQEVRAEVVERLFYETRGQPGLVGWFGELLTETYNKTPDQPLTLKNFEGVFKAALDVLPNNNILNIISKARQEPYDQFILDLFNTDETVKFKYDEPAINFLYLNGVIDVTETEEEYEIRFSCPFVQKRLFNFFSTNLFRTIDYLHDPFDDLTDTITPDRLNIKNLLSRYEAYVQKNRSWLFKDAPRRKTDLRIYEAVYHFNLFMYVFKFLRTYEGQVVPEFPTGNGKVDLIIRYAGKVYGLEVKSFRSQAAYQKALGQAAAYGKQLKVTQMWLVFFVESIDESNRAKFERVYLDQKTGVEVQPVFVQLGT